MDKTFELLEAYRTCKASLAGNNPYNLNIIDELYINENGHSRILTRLLQYKAANGHYEMLESFLQYIRDNCRAENLELIEVNDPEITQGKEFIDLWVKEKGKYAIIFENKIYNADDQEKQLSRYIKKTKDYGFEEDQIYVIYLSQNGTEEPANQSWGDFKESFKERYLNISFRNHILPWLKEFVLPNIRVKDNVLQSAIIQYIDYLEGIFDLRINHSVIYMKQKEFIISQLKLNEIEGGFEKANFLAKRIEEINELSDQLNTLKNEYFRIAREKQIEPFIKEWKHELAQLYPNFEPPKGDAHIGLLIPFRGDFVNVRIFEDSQLYCQIDKQGLNTGELNDDLWNLVKEILPRHSYKICFWRYFDLNDFKGVFSCFKEIVSLILKDKNA